METKRISKNWQKDLEFNKLVIKEGFMNSCINSLAFSQSLHDCIIMLHSWKCIIGEKPQVLSCNSCGGDRIWLDVVKDGLLVFTDICKKE